MPPRALREGLDYYSGQASKHLARVRLSHLIALDAVEAGVQQVAGGFPELVAKATIGASSVDDKVREGFHEVHLIALKANFELYLNRLLVVIGTDDVATYLTRTNRNLRLKGGELASLIGGPLDDPIVRLELIDRIVPAHDLDDLVALFKRLGVGVQQSVDQRNPTWSQIRVAFAVRHLIEHRDGRVDARFKKAVGNGRWLRSSWGERDSIDSIAKVRMKAVDVERTYDSMQAAVEQIGVALKKWLAANQK